MKSLLDCWKQEYYGYSNERLDTRISEALGTQGNRIMLETLTEGEDLRLQRLVTLISLHKWIGLLELDKFNEVHARNYDKPLRFSNKVLYDPNTFEELDIDASSCALCWYSGEKVSYHWLNTYIDDEDTMVDCDFCPMRYVSDTGCDKPFMDSSHSGDPAPMVEMLYKTLASVTIRQLELAKRIPIVSV